MRYEIKPLSLGEILDGAFQLYRNNFAAFFATALAISLPSLLSVALVNWALTGTLASVPTQQAGLGRFWLGLLVTLPISFGSYVLQTSVLTIAISDAYLGVPISVGMAFRRTVSSLGSLIGAAVLSGLGIWAGMFLLVVPGVLLMVMWLFTVQAITVEGYSATGSLKRSKDLTVGRRGRLAVLVLLLSVINIAIGYGAAAAIPNAVLALPLVGSLLKQLPSIVLAPIYPGVLTLAYFDARVRSEAFDLEMLSRNIGGTAGSVAPVAAPTA